MNFFEHQDQARAASRRMLVLFVLAVLAVVLAVDVVLIVAAGLTDKKAGALAVQPGVLAAASLITLSVIGGASMFKIALLRGGGGTVARQLGATPVPAQTTNFAWKRLRNVVEEIAIASGVPVPEIFVLERRRLGWLGEEKEFSPRATDPFWSGSYLLEGSIDREGFTPSTVTVQARLVPPRGARAVEFVVTGPRSNFLAVADLAAKRVLEALRRTPSRSESRKPPASARVLALIPTSVLESIVCA